MASSRVPGVAATAPCRSTVRQKNSNIAALRLKNVVTLGAAARKKRGHSKPFAPAQDHRRHV
jgi:hypothetical protein